MSKIRCLECDIVIESVYRHDFRVCPCKNAFIDGGHDYLRYGWTVPDSVEIVEDTSPESLR